MDDKDLPRPTGDVYVEPLSSDPRRLDLGRRLDVLFSINGKTERPSEWLNGAMFVSHNKFRSNPDWIAQAAHSLREILYRLLSPGAGGGQDTLRQHLTRYGSVQKLELSLKYMGEIYGKLCNIAHHSQKIEDINEGNFESLLVNFEKVMHEALERQLDIHTAIDRMLGDGP